MGGRNADFPDGLGEFQTLTLANPAAGAEISYSIPSNVVIQPLSIRFRLAANSTVVDRFPVRVITRSGGNILSSAQYPQATSASTTDNYHYILGQSVTNLLVSNRFMGLPPCYLESGDTITTVTTNLQTGDQFSDFVMGALVWRLP